MWWEAPEGLSGGGAVVGHGGHGDHGGGDSPALPWAGVRVLVSPGGAFLQDNATPLSVFQWIFLALWDLLGGWCRRDETWVWYLSQDLLSHLWLWEAPLSHLVEKVLLGLV